MLKSYKKYFLKYIKKSFNNLVTGDDTWVYYFEPKQKCSNGVWLPKMPHAQELLRDSTWLRKYCMYFLSQQRSSYAITCSKGQKRHRSIL